MKRRKGIALPLALLAGCLLLVLAAWMITLGTQSQYRVRNHAQAAVALYAAEAGLASAEDALHQDSAWGSPGFTVTPAECANVPYNSTTSDASYSLEVTNNSSGHSNLVTEHLPPGASVPVGDVYVVATGHAGRVNRQVGALLSVTAGVPVFQYAALGVDTLSMSDDSRTSNIASVGIATAQYGRVASASVIIGVRSRVAGDVAVPGANPAAVDADPASFETLVALPPMTGLAPISAAQHAGLAPLQLSRGGATLPPGSYEDIDVNGGTLTLEPGEYDIRNLTVEGGQIVTTGSPGSATRLFFWGSFTVTGSGDVNAGGAAPSMLVFGTGPSSPDRSVSFSGATACTMALFAPTLPVEVRDDARVTGSLVARRVAASGHAELLYDEALKPVVAGGGDIKQVSYVRL